jgi:hypothetical protein
LLEEETRAAGMAKRQPGTGNVSEMSAHSRQSRFTMKTFYLSPDAKAANPGVPTVFEIRFRAVATRNGRAFYSIHKTSEEAEASAGCCRNGVFGNGHIIETREEFFDIKPEVAA